MNQVNVKLFHPDAWEEIKYSTYLGPFIDSKGNKFDLGVFVDTQVDGDYPNNKDYPQVFDATTFTNSAPYYTSGDLRSMHKDIVSNSKYTHFPKGITAEEFYKRNESLWECYQRCLAIGIF